MPLEPRFKTGDPETIAAARAGGLARKEQLAELAAMNGLGVPPNVVEDPLMLKCLAPALDFVKTQAAIWATKFGEGFLPPAALMILQDAARRHALSLWFYRQGDYLKSSELDVMKDRMLRQAFDLAADEYKIGNKKKKKGSRPETKTFEALFQEIEAAGGDETP